MYTYIRTAAAAVGNGYGFAPAGPTLNVAAMATYGFDLGATGQARAALYAPGASNFAKFAPGALNLGTAAATGTLLAALSSCTCRETDGEKREERRGEPPSSPFSSSPFSPSPAFRSPFSTHNSLPNLLCAPCCGLNDLNCN